MIATGAETSGVPALSVTVNRVRNVPVLPVSTSAVATMFPVDDGSVWIAGTGVNACVASTFRRLWILPLVGAAGHVVTGAWPCGFAAHSRSDREDEVLV